MALHEANRQCGAREPGGICGEKPADDEARALRFRRGFPLGSGCRQAPSSSGPRRGLPAWGGAACRGFPSASPPCPIRCRHSTAAPQSPSFEQMARPFLGRPGGAARQEPFPPAGRLHPPAASPHPGTSAAGLACCAGRGRLAGAVARAGAGAVWTARLFVRRCRQSQEASGRAARPRSQTQARFLR